MLTLLTATGIPTILALPVLVRVLGQAGTMVLFGLTTGAGWIGLLLAPFPLVPLWSVLIGFGAGSFAWTMTMIGLHACTPAGTAGLSSFTQGIGFLLASVGPFGVGILHRLTGTKWAAIFGALWRPIARANGITDPLVLPYGRILIIPTIRDEITPR